MPDENEGQPTGLSQRGGSVSALRRALLNSTQETVVEMLMEAYEQIDLLRPDKARVDWLETVTTWEGSGAWGKYGWWAPACGAAQTVREAIDGGMDRSRGEALDELAKRTQELGLYDSPNTTCSQPGTARQPSVTPPKFGAG